MSNQNMFDDDSVREMMEDIISSHAEALSAIFSSPEYIEMINNLTLPTPYLLEFVKEICTNMIPVNQAIVSSMPTIDWSTMKLPWIPIVDLKSDIDFNDIAKSDIPDTDWNDFL